MEERISTAESQFKSLNTRITDMGQAFLPVKKREAFDALEAQTADPDFWNSRESAQAVVSQMNQIKPMLNKWDELTVLLDEVETSLELLKELPDEDLLVEAEENTAKLLKKTDEFELSLLLNEKYDGAAAIFSIHPGAGGTESQDWAEMLSRMYTRFCEVEGYKYEVLESQPGDVAGLKSFTMRIEGFMAYGYMKCERGVHRLVRISPFDSNKRRHTSFVSIDVSPEIEDVEEIPVEEKDLKIDTYRASGAGGQHVNRTDSAVRLTHLPTGTVVQCQNERSQHSNKASAMKVLQSKLFALEEKKRLEELASLSGNKMDIAWGSQIRSYVFHPYQMVKDMRTSMEVGNIQSVMDGNVMGFIESYLRFRSRQNAETE